MNDQTGGQLGAGRFAGSYHDSVSYIPEVDQALSIPLKETDQDLERIEDDADPAQTAANEQTPASTTVEAGTVTSEGSCINVGSGCFFSSSAAISKVDEIRADKDCVATALEGTRDSTCCETRDHKRRDDIGKQNGMSPTTVKGCSSTECGCETCRKNTTAPGRGSQGDRHSEAAERPPRLCKKKAIPPNLQYLPESLRRYLNSPSSDENPWLPKGLLHDPSIIPNWIIDAAEEEL